MDAKPVSAPPADPAAEPASPAAQAALTAPAVAETASIATDPPAAAPPEASAPVPPAPVTAAPALKVESRAETAPPRRAALMAGASSRSRFPLLAASVAVAAALGSIVGAGAYAAGSHFLVTPPPPTVKGEPQDEARELQARVAQLRASVKALADSVATLRTTAEATGKTTTAQLAKLSEQLAKVGEAQAEPAARLGKAVEALERLDKRAHAQPAPETTGSVPAARTEPPKPQIVQGWVLRHVVDGVALLEGQDRVIEVETGDNIRGIGRVEDIRRQDGRWVVVTSKGLIVARR